MPDLSNALHFGNIIIDYTVPLGEAVPATNMIYNGPVSQGSTQYAQFSRSNGQASFAVGDSVVWEGALRENALLRYNLRVISFDENNVHLGGTAEIWLTDPTYP
jgi:hypothetical protein